jgi:hypothetical protein
LTATAAAAAGGASAEATAALVKENQDLAESCRQLNELLSTKDAEMEELRDTAKTKLTEAKKKMQVGSFDEAEAEGWCAWVLAKHHAARHSCVW